MDKKIIKIARDMHIEVSLSIDDSDGSIEVNHDGFYEIIERGSSDEIIRDYLNLLDKKAKFYQANDVSDACEKALDEAYKSENESDIIAKRLAFHNSCRMVYDAYDKVVKARDEVNEAKEAERKAKR